MSNTNNPSGVNDSGSDSDSLLNSLWIIMINYVNNRIIHKFYSPSDLSSDSPSDLSSDLSSDSPRELYYLNSINEIRIIDKRLFLPKDHAIPAPRRGRGAHRLFCKQDPIFPQDNGYHRKPDKNGGGGAILVNDPADNEGASCSLMVW